MASSRLARRKAFTLLEVLVVVAIIAVLFALLMVGVFKVRAAADKAATANHLYQLGVALQHYHIVNKKYPTEEGASSTSFYQALLPYIEQKDAQPSLPVKIYLSPSRRGVEVGAKRDFGYASSFADGSVGPSVLDSPNGVSKGDITASGKSIAETALLTVVWMDPTNYRGGDATDVGWGQKMNSRSNLMAIKKDQDPTGNNTYLGGPYEGGVPTLFADNHISVVPYSTSQTDWATLWAYNTTMQRNCNTWEVPDPKGRNTCSGCGPTCRCGCVPGGGYADGSNSYSQEDILRMLREKAKTDYLTKEEEDLLRRLSPTDYYNYKNRINKERYAWEKMVREKAQRGEQLTEEEQKYYDKYITDQKNRLATQERQAWEKSVREKAASGQTLTQEEQTYYDQYQAKLQADAAKKQAAEEQKLWEQSVRDKASSGQTLTSEEQAYYDKYQQQLETQRVREWQNQTIQKATSGQTLTEEEQQYYDQYTQQQQLQQQQYQQDLQNRLNNYTTDLMSSTTTSSSSGAQPGPCSCGFTCCPDGTCICSH